jgi:prevent-host-death family protein
MAEIGAFEAKTHFSKLLERVQRGEEITVTLRGKPVAKLVPVRPGFDREKARKAAEALRALGRRLNLGKFDWAEWKAYRDEWRK